MACRPAPHFVVSIYVHANTRVIDKMNADGDDHNGNDSDFTQFTITSGNLRFCAL